MGKATRTQPIISATRERSPEREILATAIAARDEADAAEATLAQARERAAADRFRAARDVEALERALQEAREAEREALVDAYVGHTGGCGEAERPAAIRDARAALERARDRLANLVTIEAELGARIVHAQATPSLA